MTPEDLVGRIMAKHVYTVSPSDSVKKILEIMASKDIGNVVVAKGEKALGIVTERDIIKRLSKGVNILSLKAADVMSSPLITTTEETDAIKALEMMHIKKIRRLPVVREPGGKLVGIVTEKDLIYWVLKVAYAPYPPPP